jgi:caffeoyl-CoA O-methyltransferase
MAYLGRFDGSQATHASPAMAAASKEAAGAAATDPSALPTSTKWSVLSSRVEGLVAELSEVVGKQDAYCVSVSRCEGDVMAAVRDKMLATPWGDLWEKKQTMFSYGEEMSTDPLEAMLLKQLVFMAAPRRVLEIGMFVGYGSVAMLEGSPDTNVVSLEIDPYLKGWLGSCLEPFPDVAERHEVVVGPALDSLPRLHGQFDMVFVDANKAEYKRYVELIIQHKLLSSRGVIVCDNVLYNGYPYAHQHFDAQPARRHFGDAIREFNQWVADHPKLEQVVLPVRDGISIIRLRSDRFLGQKKPQPKMPEPQKPEERVETANNDSVPPPPAPVVKREKRGNLVQYNHTWRILRPGAWADCDCKDDDVPMGAIFSDCRVEPGVSEYAEGSSAKAWESHSTIEFDYRVVEVPRGRLLDPTCDALIFGHLANGSEERAAAMTKPQRRLVVIDETVHTLYGDRVRAYFKACGVEHELLVLPMTEETKSMETALEVCKKM